MFSAGRLSAARAFEIGLVNAVYPQDKLMEAAMELVSKIGKNAPLAVAACKKAMYSGVEVSLAEGIAIEAKAFSKLFETTDAKKGLNAFSNKEKYDFTGE
jgi:enoyl-CoA hydratase